MTELYGALELKRERVEDRMASPKQAQFVASMWTQALGGNKQDYHLCLKHIWQAESANHLSNADAAVILDWLLSDEKDTDGNPQLDPLSIAETELVVREARK